MFKALLGYDIEEGVTPEEYERWLFDVHAPDLLSNPHLRRLVLNKVVDRVQATSSGSPAGAEALTFYRIAEMHFEDREEYERYRKWFEDNPIAADRGPAGRTRFRFYVIAESHEVTR